MAIKRDQFYYKVYKVENDGTIRVNHRHMVINGLTAGGVVKKPSEFMPNLMPIERMIQETHFSSVGELPNVLSGVDMRNNAVHKIDMETAQPDIVATTTTSPNGYNGLNARYLSTVNTVTGFTGDVVLEVNRTLRVWAMGAEAIPFAFTVRGEAMPNGRGGSMFQWVIYSKPPAGFYADFTINGLPYVRAAAEVNDTRESYAQKVADAVNARVPGIAYVTDGIVVTIDYDAGTFFWSTEGGVYTTNETSPIQITAHYEAGQAIIDMPENDGQTGTYTYSFTGNAVLKQDPLITRPVDYVGVLIENKVTECCCK